MNNNPTTNVCNLIELGLIDNTWIAILHGLRMMDNARQAVFFKELGFLSTDVYIPLILTKTSYTTQNAT
jgi:hypothetical protein